MTTEHDKHRPWAALKKTVMPLHKLLRLITIARTMSRASVARLSYVRLLQLYKEATGLVADSMAVWPILGITTLLDSISGWMPNLLGAL